MEGTVFIKVAALSHFSTTDKVHGLLIIEKLFLLQFRIDILKKIPDFLFLPLIPFFESIQKTQFPIEKHYDIGNFGVQKKYPW